MDNSTMNIPTTKQKENNMVSVSNSSYISTSSSDNGENYQPNDVAMQEESEELLIESDKENLKVWIQEAREEDKQDEFIYILEKITNGEENLLNEEQKKLLVETRDHLRNVRKIKLRQQEVSRLWEEIGAEEKEKLSKLLSDTNPSKHSLIKTISDSKIEALNKEELDLLHDILELKSLHQENAESLYEINQTEPIATVKDLEADLKRMEKQYTAPKYGVKVFSEGLANIAFAGNVAARIREVKIKKKINRILSSHINGNLMTKRVYSKIETDCQVDYIKLLEPWTENSFGSNTTHTERDFIGFKMEICGVDKNIKLELEIETVKNMREIGIRNFKRATRFDQSSGKEMEVNRVEFNPRDFLVMQTLIRDGVSLSCSNTNHDVELILDRVKYCKQCSDFGHKAKGCVRPSKCSRCSNRTHVAAMCPGIEPIKCPQCNLAHEGGTNNNAIIIK